MPKTDVAVGPVVEKVTRTRTLAPQEVAGSAEPINFWEYVEELHASPERWEREDCKVYLYRLEPPISRQTAEPSFVDKTDSERCYGQIEMPDGHWVPFSIEAIREKFGGTVFRAILKRGRERIAETRIVIEAPAKFARSSFGSAAPLPSAMQGGNGSNGIGGDPTANIAGKAMDIVSSQQVDGIRIATDALRTMADVLATRANPPAPASTMDSLKDDIFRQLVSRALEPPRTPDTLELLLKAKELFGPPPATNGLKDTLEFIGALKTSGLFAIGGRGGAGLFEVAGQVLPSVANAAVEGIREWRLGIEAQERAIAMQKGIAPGSVRPNPPQVEVLPPAPSVSTPMQPVPVTEQTDPGLDWVLGKVVEIMKDLTLTVDEQVDEVLAWLYRAKPEMVAQILDPPKIHPTLAPGEQGILQLFQSQPVLQQVPVNPRLTEFIKKFVPAAQEAEAERVAAMQKQPPPKASA
jgi:hypothetical protein